MLVAGMDTTAKTLTQVFMRLKKHPETFTKLKAELDSNFPEKGSNPENLASIIKREKIDELEYLSNFIKECIRIQSAAFETVQYRSQEDIILEGNVVIPKGVELVLALQTMLTDPKEWISPQEFIPERFDLDNKMSKTPSGKKRHHLAYQPFSFGPRACPGRSLAMMELKVFIIFFVKFMDWEVSQDQLDNENLYFSFFSGHKLLANVKSD